MSLQESELRKEMTGTEMKLSDEARRQLEKDRKNLQVGGSREEKLDVGETPY